MKKLTIQYNYLKLKGISQYCCWLGVYFLFLILTGMGIGGIGSLLRLFAFFPVAIWIITNHKVKFTLQIEVLILFLLICATSILWSWNITNSISRVMSHFLLLVLLISATAYKYTEREITYLKKCLIWSSRISAIVIMITGNYSEGRLVLSGIITEDPNYLSAYFMFGIANCIIILMKKNVSNSNKAKILIELFFYLYLLFSTGSRGGLFAVVSVIIVIIIFYNEKINQSSAKLIRKKIILILMLIFAASYILTLLPSIAGRFSIQEIKESNGTGRYNLWFSALDTFNQSTVFRKLFGYGTASSKRIISHFTNLPNAVYHNVFVENLVEIGIIGLILYCAHIGSFFLATIKKKDVFCLGILSGMVVLSLSTSIYTFKPYWNIMIFIVCLSNSKGIIEK